MASMVEHKAQHSQGPWEIWNSERRKAGQPWEITRADKFTGNALATVPHRGAFSEANARLIAAAPDLLAQLENTLATLALMADAYSHGSATRNTLEAECDAIRAAINKASA